MRYLIAVLALAGLIDSCLALRIHLHPEISACKVTENWDCGAVNTSRFAVFPPTSFDEDTTAHHVHIPVAIFGIIGYALVVILALANRLWLVLHAAEIGFFCAAMLSYIEAYLLEKWCIYCVWSQGFITAILLATIVTLFLNHRKKKLAAA